MLQHISYTITSSWVAKGERSSGDRNHSKRNIQDCDSHQYNDVTTPPADGPDASPRGSACHTFRLPQDPTFRQIHTRPHTISVDYIRLTLLVQWHHNTSEYVCHLTRESHWQLKFPTRLGGIPDFVKGIVIHVVGRSKQVGKFLWRQFLHNSKMVKLL